MQGRMVVENPEVPNDDLLDVMEMTQKLESYICDVLQENEMTLCMSALMSATINCILAQCQTLDEVVFYRNIFMDIFDSSIRTIKIRRKD